jgi:hypothetical protein
MFVSPMLLNLFQGLITLDFASEASVSAPNAKYSFAPLPLT